MQVSYHQMRNLTLRYVIPVLALALLIGIGTGSFTECGSKKYRYNQSSIAALEREIANHKGDQRYLAVLRGLRWSVIYCQDDTNFDSTFTNYLNMLDELTLHHPPPALMRIVHDLILKELERALPRFPKLFSPDASGLDDFVSLLPIAYHHKAPLAPLKTFARIHFAQLLPADRLEEFRRASKKLDYQRLSDLVKSATSIDMAYCWGAANDFPLPPDHFGKIIAESAGVPLPLREDEPGYAEQNYYATHLMLALQHRSQRGFKASSIGDRLFFYLAQQFDAVRHRMGDLELQCEYLSCFKKFAPSGVGFINEGELQIMSRQKGDGSWEAFGENGHPRDRRSPTWNAIRLLVQ